MGGRREGVRGMGWEIGMERLCVFEEFYVFADKEFFSLNKSVSFNNSHHFRTDSQQ